MERVAIITGGAGSMGVVIAEHLIQDGYAVILADVNEATTSNAAERLGTASYFVGDLTQEKNASGLAQHASTFGDITAVINTAGIAPAGPLAPSRAAIEPIFTMLD